MSEVTPWRKPTWAEEVADLRAYLRTDVLPEYRENVQITGQRFTPRMLTKVWIAALRSEGVDAEHGKGAWNGKYRPDLPYVVQFPCPEPHRTEDHSADQVVRLVIEDDGWPTIYDGHSCEMCSIESIERWMVRCRRCEADEDCALVDEHGNTSCHHPPGEEKCHDPYDLHQGACGILFAVIDAFEQTAKMVWATWWDESPDAAEEWARREAAVWQPGADNDAYVASERARAKAWLDEQRPMLVIDNAGGQRRQWTDEDGVKWLDQHDVPVEIGQAAAWDIARKIAGHPPQAVVRRAQALRKSRAGLGGGEADD